MTDNDTHHGRGHHLSTTGTIFVIVVVAFTFPWVWVAFKIYIWRPMTRAAERVGQST